ncbi:hypothetical protein [Sphingobium chungbukense]|uniref:DUF3618 domain-containing protein n=1 Tax=Sphingobium chungbukense TaxID=56193 RepID=A0A0M3AJB6_9SPHN|nr:hypothetical protein [Sphingobium chungbukense]KKW90073.1 hypothetical protein YP76_21750 [Sphingobium chungbukense]
MSREEAYQAAANRAEERKATFLSTMQTARERVAPARLKQDAKVKVSQTVLDGAAYAAAKVQQRPAATAAALGAFALYVMRRPLGTFFRRIYVRISNHTDETSETDHG